MSWLIWLALACSGTPDAPTETESSASETEATESEEATETETETSSTESASETEPETEPETETETEVDCDVDGDGFFALACEGDDCDDDDPAVNPDAIERFDAIDNDCDGTTDAFDLTDRDDRLTTAGVEYEGRIGSMDNVAWGDVDGDGTPDLVVGAPFEAEEDGAVYVLSGVDVPSWTGDITADAAWTYAAAESGGNLGILPQQLGDNDGDGVADLLMAARTSEDGGVVYWFAGGPVTGAMDVDDADLVVRNDEGSGRLGWGLDGAGDLDGDGTPDLVLGDADYDSGKGRVLMYSGLPGTGEVSLEDADGELSSSVSSGMGQTTVVVGDLSGDGYDELVLGVPNIGSGAGGYWVLTGGSSLPDGDVSSGAWLTVEASLRGGGMGRNSRGVSPVADLDGSGSGDIALANYEGDGNVYLLLDPGSGTYGTADITTFVSYPGYAGQTAATGTSLAMHDVDKDGLADLLLGAMRDSNATYKGGSVGVLYGATDLSTRGPIARSDMDGLLDAGQDEQYLGTSVLVPGDLTADGLDDLVVCPSWHTEIDYREGAIVVLPGL